MLYRRTYSHFGKGRNKSWVEASWPLACQAEQKPTITTENNAHLNRYRLAMSRKKTGKIEIANWGVCGDCGCDRPSGWMLWWCSDTEQTTIVSAKSIHFFTHSCLPGNIREIVWLGNHARMKETRQFRIMSTRPTSRQDWAVGKQKCFSSIHQAEMMNDDDAKTRTATPGLVHVGKWAGERNLTLEMKGPLQPFARRTRNVVRYRGCGIWKTPSSALTEIILDQYYCRNESPQPTSEIHNPLRRGSRHRALRHREPSTSKVTIAALEPRIRVWTL